MKDNSVRRLVASIVGVIFAVYMMQGVEASGVEDFLTIALFVLIGQCLAYLHMCVSDMVEDWRKSDG